MDTFLNTYLARGGSKKDYEYQAALGALAEYSAIHQENGTQLPELTCKLLSKHLADYDGEVSYQPVVTREAFFARTESPFPEFLASRHSVRHFSAPAPLGAIKAAIDMARRVPSARNRQYVHAHVLLNKHVVSEVLTMQGGNVGFGHLVDQAILITVDLNAVLWVGEHRDLWFNAGLFCMALYSALHYNKIGSCPLLWLDSPENEAALRKLVSIPENEVPVTLIACGEVPEQFTVAKSDRKPVESYMTLHE